MNEELKLWWQRPLRVVQPNLQVQDTAKIDPEQLAAQMKELGANAIVFNVGGIYGWYPSNIPFHTVNPYLPQHRDLLRDVIEACNKQDIRFIARFDFSKAEDSVYLQRPQWFVRDGAGEPQIVGARRPGPWSMLMNTCINGDYRNEAVAEPVLREVLNHYDIDGIFFNAPGYFYCHCERCKTKYRAMYGKELPSSSTELEPDFASRCMRDNMEAMHRLIKQTRGEVPMILYYNLYRDNLFERAETTDLMCTEPQDILSLGHKEIPEFWKPALSIKLGRSLPGRPAPFGIVHSCPGMDWRHTGLPTAEYKFWLAQIPANGGQIWHSLTGVPETITDKRILDTVAELNQNAAIVDPYMEDAAAVSQVALMWNAGRSAEGWADALINKQIPFDVLLPEQAEAERLASYKAVIIPEQFRWTPSFLQLLLAFVEQGGYIVTEGELPAELSALYELVGIEKETFASESLVASYLRFEGEGNPLQAGLARTEIIAHRGKVTYCKPVQGTTVLATLVPPFSPLESVGAPPERASLPVSHTDLPLAVQHRVGKGSALYFPFSLSGLINDFKLEEHYVLIDNAINMALGDERLVSVTSYQGLQLTLFRKDGDLLLHLVNGAGRRPLSTTLPLYNIEVELRVDDAAGPCTVQRLIAGDQLSSEYDGRYIRFTVPRLDVWECIKFSSSAPASDRL
ncbi:alpha-amylase family protein [Paenibacillus sp. strain BS8-2]